MTNDRQVSTQLRKVLNSNTSKDKKKPEEEYHFTSFRVQDNLIMDQTSKGLVVWDTSNDTWEIVQEHHKVTPLGNTTIDHITLPLKNKTLEVGQLILADEPIPCDSLSDLISEILEKSKKWLYIAPEEWDIFEVQVHIAVAS